MLDLFHRRADKGGETFPARLPNNSQAATVSARRLHQRIVWKRSADFREPMIQREIIADQVRASFCYPQRIAALFRIYWPISNRAVKSVVDRFPMKHLAGIERHCEIEIGRGNFCEVHKQTSNTQRPTSNRETRVARREI